MKQEKPKTPDDAPVEDVLPDADEIERSPLPFLARINWHALALVCLTALIWSIFSKVDRIIVAKGKLVTTSSNIIVQPLETSIIQSLNVRSGQVVKKGEILAVLDSTFAQADKELVRTRLASLNTHVQRLEAELANDATLDENGKNAMNQVQKLLLDGRVHLKGGPFNDSEEELSSCRINNEEHGESIDCKLQNELLLERQANANAQFKKLEAKVARLRSSIRTNVKNQELMAARVDVIREMEAMKEKLLKQGSVAKVSLLEAQERRLNVEREMQHAKNRQKELESELASVLAEKEAFGKNLRQKTMEELLSVSRERDALYEQLLKADKRRNLVTLTAPSDAIVLEVSDLSQGSVVKAAGTLFTLVPLGSALEGEVKINSKDIGYAKVGDTVHIKIDAFPSTRHGLMEGTIRTISEDAFEEKEADKENDNAYYLSRIRLGEKKLKKMPKGARLLPGMSLSAEVVVGKRSIISYLLWPVTKTLDESIQEP